MPNTNLNTLTVANTVIPLDEEQRINLNALHKASGTGKSKQPYNWVRLQSTQELIEELERSSDLRNGLTINKVQGGTKQGTFAHQLLAISYAGWISPAFQLQVNQVFLDTKRFKTPERERVNVDREGYTSLIQENIYYDQQYKDLQSKYINVLELALTQSTQQGNVKHKKKPNIPLTQDEKNSILKLRSQGLGLTAIAKQVKRSRSSVRNTLINAGIY